MGTVKLCQLDILFYIVYNYGHVTGEIIMARMLYDQIADKLKSSTFIAPAFLITMVLLFQIAVNTVEDYSTSLGGYKAYPTVKAVPLVVYTVAALPQTIQQLMAYIMVGLSALRKEERNFFGWDIAFLAFMVWLGGFLIDGYWDYIYKAGPYLAGLQPTSMFWGYIQLPGIYWPAVWESFGVFGIFSELAGAVALGMFVALMKNGAFEASLDLAENIGQMITEIVSFLFKFVSLLFGGIFKGVRITDNNSQTNNRPPRQRDTR